MKAIRVHEFGPPEVMKLEEVPDPRPAAGQLVVKLHAIGVNPVDTYIRAGTPPSPPGTPPSPPLPRGGSGGSLPYTPGKDAAGVVESVGDGVTRFKPGDRVYTHDALSGT